MRARKHLSELERLVRTYGRSARPVWNKWWEPHYEHMQAWWLTWSRPPPDDLPVIIGDVAHNLRSALDVLLCDLARGRDRSTSDLKFPFADGPEKWAENLGKTDFANKLGPEIVAAVAEMEAYRDGPGSGLRHLHDLNILDKHRLIVPTFAACWADVPIELTAGLTRDRLSGGMVRLGDGDTFLVRKGLELSLLPRPRTGPIPYFPHGLPQGSPFAGHPVVETLSHAADSVHQWVEAFASRFPNG